ncbi:hypothetical protein SAMN05444266_104168 [Chitinophaga jiangningensis]|uniref:Lipoprotein n=1 Tax=Chitinophaga jiangningensis TaxID=1419482 RepID=A0A1M7C2H8_9BACT|nr:hypothetical protein [Chitinophaga jiangningensis]SHL61421.1 hypothetical protein SAMN05444266_104168 [Chitinophaga jiangningensis]
MKKYQWFVLFMVISACTATHVTNEWHTPDPLPSRYRRILLVGILPDSVQQWRSELESNLAAKLELMGHTAIKSSTSPYHEILKEKDEKAAVLSLQDAAVDAVLIITMHVGITDTKETPCWFDYYLLQDPEYTYFWQYYQLTLSTGSVPKDNRKVFYWEANFYDMRDCRLIYSLQSAAIDIRNATTFSHRYSREIMKRLEKAGIIITLYPSDVE